MYTLLYMGSFAIDTHKAILRLTKRGVPKAQAEAITELLQDITTSELVMKDDLEAAVGALETMLHKQTATLVKWTATILVAHAALVVGLVALIV